jgi:hypothetical protein
MSFFSFARRYHTSLNGQYSRDMCCISTFVLFALGSVCLMKRRKYVNNKKEIRVTNKECWCIPGHTIIAMELPLFIIFNLLFVWNIHKPGEYHLRWNSSVITRKRKKAKEFNLVCHRKIFPRSIISPRDFWIAIFIKAPPLHSSKATDPRESFVGWSRIPPEIRSVFLRYK